MDSEVAEVPVGEGMRDSLVINKICIRVGMSDNGERESSEECRNKKNSVCE